MMTSAAALDRIKQALAAQRQAAVTGDASALEAASRSLDEALALLRRQSPSLDDQQTLLALRQEATLNAELVQKAGAANQRALRVFFESSATYGADGAGRLESPSRRLNAA